LVRATDGEFCTTWVKNPLGAGIQARWGWLGDRRDATAVIEMAAASGLTLLSTGELDPLRTTTFGTGQLIAAAIATGARHILLGLGGSATHDGGCGAAMALGVRFFDAQRRRLETPIRGGDLGRIARIDTSGLNTGGASITICRDVDNPLCGPTGAAAVYAPQKGATAEQVARLDRDLARLGARWRDQLGVDVTTLAGAGAAGGMAGGLIAMLGATARPGIDVVLDAVGFDERIAGATLCLTGEGALDGQSLAGKACLGVAKAAHRAGVPTCAIVGRLRLVDDARLRAVSMTAVELAPGLATADSMERAAALLEARTAEVVRLLW
jgi:glycerate kinase